MLETFQSFINHHHLFDKHEKVLVAVSGGVDSTVLLHLLHQHHDKLGVLHCRYQLRGGESEEDAEFVKSMAEAFQLPFYVHTFNTENYAEEKGISIQMAARDLRFQWFKELADQNEADKIALGHNLDDSIETVLFNLTKGTGLAGLTGIDPQQGIIIRPLLPFTRKEILQYAMENKMSWREDSSNDDTKYSRNLIRKNVIPVLRQINPNLGNTIKSTLWRLQSAYEIQEETVNAFLEGHIVKKGVHFFIELKALMEHKQGKLMLLEILKPYQFTLQEVLQIWLKLERIRHAEIWQSGNIFAHKGYQVNLDREYLILSPERKTFEPVKISEMPESVSLDYYTLHFSLHDASEVEMSSSGHIAYLDFDQLEFPVYIRNWDEGDHFKPLGMEHFKKLSDFLIDEKVPVNLKYWVDVLISGQHIAWVIDYRIDNRYKITPETKRVLKIEWQPNLI